MLIDDIIKDRIEKEYSNYNDIDVIRGNRTLAIVDDCISDKEKIKNKLLNIKNYDKYKIVLETSINIIDHGSKIRENITFVIYLLNNGFYNYSRNIKNFEYIFTDLIKIDILFKNIHEIKKNILNLSLCSDDNLIICEKKLLSASEPPKSASRALAKGLSVSEPAGAVSSARQGLNINDVAELIYKYYNYNKFKELDYIVNKINNIL
jgi:hypothetical protein